MTSRAVLGAVIPASQVRHQGLEQAAPRILNVADRADLDGYWIHLDVDILDPGVMPSVDSPDIPARPLQHLPAPRIRL
jgi:arginase